MDTHYTRKDNPDAVRAHSAPLEDRLVRRTLNRHAIQWSARSRCSRNRRSGSWRARPSARV
jgi:hypothetical protein